MPIAVLQTAKTPDRLEFMSKTAVQQIANKIGIRGMTVANDKDIAQLTEQMTKQKKPAEFAIDFDGAWFSYLVRVGTFKRVCNEVNVIEDNSITDKAKVVQNLIQHGAATPKQVQQLKERNLI